MRRQGRERKSIQIQIDRLTSIKAETVQGIQYSTNNGDSLVWIYSTVYCIQNYHPKEALVANLFSWWFRGVRCETSFENNFKSILYKSHMLVDKGFNLLIGVLWRHGSQLILSKL